MSAPEDEVDRKFDALKKLLADVSPRPGESVALPMEWWRDPAGFAAAVKYQKATLRESFAQMGLNLPESQMEEIIGEFERLVKAALEQSSR